MNLHPIIVHFPIALLTIWALCEIFPLSKLFPKVNWIPVQNFLVVVGFVGGWVSQITGEQAENLVARSDLVQIHSFFSQASMILFGTFAVEVVVNFIKVKYPTIYYKLGILSKIIDWFLNLIKGKFFRIFLALIAFVAIFITGLLGGVLVYGPTADPLAPFVLKLLGL